MLGHMIACSGVMARMKVDDYSREASSGEQVLVASASGFVNVDRTGGSDLNHLYFLF